MPQDPSKPRRPEPSPLVNFGRSGDRAKPEGWFCAIAVLAGLAAAVVAILVVLMRAVGPL